MLPISVFVWLLFEGYNFVLNNWEYGAVPPEIWLRWPGYTLAFASVLPGIFITSDLAALLLGRSSKSAASECDLSLTKTHYRPSPVFMTLGVLLTVSPLIWPHYLFPLIWFGPIVLLNPLLEKVGIRSLSLRFVSGERKRVWSLMLGGLLCGFMWEFWNYWAGSKWTYTIPFFGNYKVFEMPILGFLGFIPFALECWILYHLLKMIPRKIQSPGGRIAFWLCLIIFYAIMFRGIDSYTVVRFADKNL